MWTHQLRTHLLHFGNDISEELSHVFLLTGVQWLVVHRVVLAETIRVV